MRSQLPLLPSLDKIDDFSNTFSSLTSFSGLGMRKLNFYLFFRYINCFTFNFLLKLTYYPQALVPPSSTNHLHSETQFVSLHLFRHNFFFFPHHHTSFPQLILRTSLIHSYIPFSSLHHWWLIFVVWSSLLMFFYFLLPTLQLDFSQLLSFHWLPFISLHCWIPLPAFIVRIFLVAWPSFFISFTSLFCKF